MFPHGMPLPIDHMLTPPTGKANSSSPTDWTFDTSGKVINLNMNAAFMLHILENLQFLQTVAELYADADYYFAHSFNSTLGSKASSLCLVRCALTPWATRVGPTVLVTQELAASV